MKASTLTVRAIFKENFSGAGTTWTNKNSIKGHRNLCFTGNKKGADVLRSLLEKAGFDNKVVYFPVSGLGDLAGYIRVRRCPLG